MILWSVLPTDMVLDNTMPLVAYDEIECNGMKCLVEKTSSTQCRVVRMLTTNPNDYLRPELQPGTLLTYEPILKTRY